ncbi:MAG: HesB/IscA family protein [bacterium]
MTMQTGAAQASESNREYNLSLTDADLVVTAGARQRIAGLVRDTDGEAQAVRIYVSGGGCGGMNYGMTFAERAEEKDCVMNGDDDFKLVVDPVALSFLHGAEIDYVDDGVNASFVFNNVFQAVGGSGACGGCGGGA